MNRHSLKVLAVVVVALVVALIAMEAGKESGSPGGGPLLEGLKERINDVTNVTVTYAGDDGTATINRQDNAWVVVERNGYPADVAALRKLLLAMADATIVEPKTADPARYDRLGVQDPEADGSEGIRVVVSGDGYSAGLVVGKSPNPNSRYVRRDGEAESWLVDTDPSPPATAAGWLVRDLFDVDANRVRSVEIVHADGESIRVAKDSEAGTSFTVLDVPEGRELSYPSIGNSIGGALNDLQLEDVRVAEDVEPAFTTTVETFDGLTVVARGYVVEDGLWMDFRASAAVPEQAAGVAPDDSGEETRSDEPGDESADENAADPAAAAGAINAVADGWQFRIPDYKTDQLGRRWADLLKAEEQTG